MAPCFSLFVHQNIPLILDQPNRCLSMVIKEFVFSMGGRHKRLTDRLWELRIATETWMTAPSLKCQPSPPPNPQGARPLWVRLDSTSTRTRQHQELRWKPDLVSAHARMSNVNVVFVSIWFCHFYHDHKTQRFSFECRKTKTKVITLANQNRCKQHNEPIRIWSKYM